MVLPVAPTPEEKRSGFQCEDGRVHQWSYLKDLRSNYRCSLCMVVMPKARLKELTDNA